MFRRVLAALLAVLIAGVFSTADSQETYLRGYVRTDRYVQPHFRSAPDPNVYNNYSTRADVNPYNGKVGATGHAGTHPMTVSASLGAATCCLIATQAVAADRSLSGFDRFRFGMTEQQVRELTAIEESRPEEGDTSLKATEPITIDGLGYQLSFLIRPGGLFRINMLHVALVRPLACTGDFIRVFGSITARFGNPDQPVKRESVGGISTRESAAFTFRDGASIKLTSIYIDRTCAISVAYSGGSGGG
jgi:hypothetical protein